MFEQFRKGKNWLETKSRWYCIFLILGLIQGCTTSRSFIEYKDELQPGAELYRHRTAIAPWIISDSWLQPKQHPMNVSAPVLDRFHPDLNFIESCPKGKYPVCPIARYPAGILEPIRYNSSARGEVCSESIMTTDSNPHGYSFLLFDADDKTTLGCSYDIGDEQGRFTYHFRVPYESAYDPPGLTCSFDNRYTDIGLFEVTGCSKNVKKEGCEQVNSRWMAICKTENGIVLQDCSQMGGPEKPDNRSICPIRNPAQISLLDMTPVRGDTLTVSLAWPKETALWTHSFSVAVDDHGVAYIALLPNRALLDSSNPALDTWQPTVSPQHAVAIQSRSLRKIGGIVASVIVNDFFSVANRESAPSNDSVMQAINLSAIGPRFYSLRGCSLCWTESQPWTPHLSLHHLLKRKGIKLKKGEFLQVTLWSDQHNKADKDAKGTLFWVGEEGTILDSENNRSWVPVFPDDEIHISSWHPFEVRK